MYSLNVYCVPTFGNPRIEAYLQLPEAYRSLSRPSSAPDAKAFALCSSSLELPIIVCSLELLEFLLNKIFCRIEKVFPFRVVIHLSVKLYVLIS